MGLQLDIQTDVANAFDNDLADAVKDFTLTQYSRSGYDAATGSVTRTSNTENSRGVFYDYTIEELSALGIDPQSSKVIVLQNELTLIPRIADTITRLSDLQVFRIFKVEKDPADATYILHCLAGNP